ncbi:MAG: helix-turn-helix domain-containing protein [Spirochaetaceae bacterium]|nr:helix-turn-helix domain-containing protein [Spirochaetaceae bacterium]
MYSRYGYANHPCYGAYNDVNFFTEDEEQIITLLHKQGEIARRDIETALDVSQAMAVRLLRGLVNKGAMQVIGRGKKKRYRNWIPRT